VTERALRRWLIGGILAVSTMVVLPVIAILAALVSIGFGGNWWVFCVVFWTLAGAAMWRIGLLLEAFDQAWQHVVGSTTKADIP
jgi:hypothetical protein